MTTSPTITPTEEREYIRAAREHRMRKRIELLNRLWWETKGNTLSRVGSGDVSADIQPQEVRPAQFTSEPLAAPRLG